MDLPLQREIFHRSRLCGGLNYISAGRQRSRWLAIIIDEHVSPQEKSFPPIDIYRYLPPAVSGRYRPRRSKIQRATSRVIRFTFGPMHPRFRLIIIHVN